MIKFRSKSIKQKIFITTSISLFLVSIVIYLVVYALLPGYYYKYKTKTINKEIESLISVVKNIEFENAKDYIDAFANRNNVALNIHDNLGNIIYSSNTYLSVIYESKGGNEVILVPEKNRITQHVLGITPRNYNSGFYTSSQNIEFKDFPYKLILSVSSALQPINEASVVILSLAPYIIIIILGISAVGAYIYSKFIADPLLRINKVAKKMSKLDFETKCTIKSNDEIGQIASTLNELSDNLKTTMEELERSNRQLKSDIEKERELESKRREFVATISHELKSPIAAAKGQIEGMINNIGVFKDREKYLRRSYSTINDMEKLVNEILEMSKLETYDFSPKKENVNLTLLVRKIIKEQEFLCISKNLTVNKEIDDNLVVIGDSKLILKALSNIINNAMKYSPEGETINIYLKKDDNNIEFKVVNTGIELESDDIKEVFKPFYRVEKSRSRSTGGSGLGLYIVKNILDAHRLEYKLDSYDNLVEFTVNFHLDIN